MKAWVYQREKGRDNPWSVGWYDKDGTKHRKVIGRKLQANKFRDKVQADFADATYQQVIPMKWADFRSEYEAKILPKLKPSTAVTYKTALKRFEQLAKPNKVETISTNMLDSYVAKRLKQRGHKRDSLVSPATVNAELRTLRAVLAVAKDWKYISEVPKIKYVKEPEHIKRFVTMEHFEAMYQQCYVALQPNDLSYEPEDWWQAFLLFSYMTGWRVSEPLALQRTDLDLKAGIAITRAEDNKGNRDEAVSLHPIVVEHLQRIRGFTAEMFPWSLSQRGLYVEFHRIQQAAGIHLPCRGKHEHTEACFLYGFHDLRRGFATVTGKRLNNRLLQKMMRHKSYKTTERYVDMRHQLDGAVELLETPELTIHSEPENRSGT